ncbi:antibiotic biosynthesis monooxygenase [soil metagenome]
MFIAMNRFRIAPGFEAAFEAMWRARDSRLREVEGFKSFKLLNGPAAEDHALYVSHSAWADRAAFEDWTRSEHFRAAHAGAGGSREMYLGPPQLELFESVVEA